MRFYKVIIFFGHITFVYERSQLCKSLSLTPFFRAFLDFCQMLQEFYKNTENEETSMVIRGIWPYFMDAFNPISMEPMAFLLHECYF